MCPSLTSIRSGLLSVISVLGIGAAACGPASQAEPPSSTSTTPAASAVTAAAQPQSPGSAGPRVDTVEKGGRGVALVFSGRPDPEWDIPAGRVAELLALLAGAPPAKKEVSAPGLGYRGCTLVVGDRSWSAFGGVVVVARSGKTEQTLMDRDRAFERALAGSAPAGSLPAGVLE